MNNFFMEAGNPWCQNSLGELFEALCVSLPAYLEWVSKRDFDCHQMCSCVLHTGLWPGKAFPVLRQLRSIVEVCCGFLGCSKVFALHSFHMDLDSLNFYASLRLGPSQDGKTGSRLKTPLASHWQHISCHFIIFYWTFHWTFQWTFQWTAWYCSRHLPCHILCGPEELCSGLRQMQKPFPKTGFVR